MLVGRAGCPGEPGGGVQETSSEGGDGGHGSKVKGHGRSMAPRAANLDVGLLSAAPGPGASARMCAVPGLGLRI